MVERVILPVFCVEFFSWEDAYTRERDYPDLHLAGIGVSKWLKLAADGPRGEIVVYEASIAGRVFLGIDIPFLGDEGSQVCRVVIRTRGN